MAINPPPSGFFEYEAQRLGVTVKRVRRYFYSVEKIHGRNIALSTVTINGLDSKLDAAGMAQFTLNKIVAKGDVREWVRDMLSHINGDDYFEKCLFALCYSMTDDEREQVIYDKESPNQYLSNWWDNNKNSRPEWIEYFSKWEVARSLLDASSIYMNAYGHTKNAIKAMNDIGLAVDEPAFITALSPEIKSLIKTLRDGNYVVNFIEKKLMGVSKEQMDVALREIIKLIEIIPPKMIEKNYYQYKQLFQWWNGHQLKK